MPHIKAQVEFQGATNIPEDKFINTFHFQVVGASLEDAATSLTPQLGAFYGTTQHPSASGMGQFLSQFILRPFEIKFYDMTVAEGERVPVVVPLNLSPYVTATSDLPEEVAVCLSFHGAPPVTPRTRGRIYLGPLNNLAVVDATAVVPARVSTSLQNQGCTQMTALAAATDQWVVYSPTSNVTTTVTGGFVDNAFDTQRRRGPVTTARTVWPAP